jgi:type IV secretion system protein VirB8
MRTDPALDRYLKDAASWDSDREARSRRSERIAWWVAAGGWLCAIACAVSLVFLMPLKRVEPFVVRVDNTTGIVDVVPVYAGRAPMDEAVTRYFLNHYISVCERFNLVTAESDYEECGAFHTSQRNQAWYALWNTNNPRSPLNLHKDGSSVRVEVESVSFFKRANGVQDLAQVRYLKAERPSSSTAERATHWIATVQYAYSAPSGDPKTRRWNPLGFKIIELGLEPEIQSTPVAGSGKTLLGAAQ